MPRLLPRPSVWMLTGLLGLAVSAPARAQTDPRLADLEHRLSDAQHQADDLQRTIAALAAEIRSLRGGGPAAPPAAAAASTTEPAPEPSGPEATPRQAFADQIVRPSQAADERHHEIAGVPEFFVQTRFRAGPLAGTTVETAPSNFDVTRMETRWAGRISPRIGLGFELQYHPATHGSPEELVNDAFIDYYVSPRASIRVGQFITPFGFDVQHSSAVRESPERAIFAGYFFPGQRDRGAMLHADLPHGVQTFVGLFNGNRFFLDSNRRLNLVARVRKVFERTPLAVGASVRAGQQLLPPGVTGSAHESLVGLDAQWAWRRLGLRAEMMTGDRPSTFLSLVPEFIPAFQPGLRSTGAALFGAVQLTAADQAYGRYDWFGGDPVFGYNVRAINLGYQRLIGGHARIGVDYQFKNRLTANDDFVNNRLQISWSVEH